MSIHCRTFTLILQFLLGFGLGALRNLLLTNGFNFATFSNTGKILLQCKKRNIQFMYTIDIIKSVKEGFFKKIFLANFKH